MGAGPMIVSAALALMGVLAIGATWLCLGRGAGLVAPAADALALFFVSQLGKYVPGAVWPVVAQMEFGRRWDAPRRLLLTAYALFILVIAATGLAFGGVLLLLSGASGADATYGWLLLLVPMLLACLHPRVVPYFLNRVLALAGREPLASQVRPSTMVKAVTWALTAWTLLGLHVAVLLSGLGVSGGTMVATAVGAMALGWAAGLLVVFAPAGLGVRDSILVAAFAGIVGGGPALAVAVASRVLLLLADLALAGLGLLLTARSQRAR